MLLEVTRERPAVLPADRATLLIEHASELVTLGWSFGDGARGGLWQGDPGLIHDGAIAIGGDGRVLAVGPTARVRDAVDLSPKARIYNATRLLRSSRLHRRLRRGGRRGCRRPDRGAERLTAPARVHAATDPDRRRARALRARSGRGALAAPRRAAAARHQPASS